MRGRPTTGKKISAVALAFLLPPASVALTTGEACESWVNFGLMFLGWIPATVHALMVGFSDVRCGCVPMGNVDAGGAMPTSSSNASGYSAQPQRAVGPSYTSVSTTGTKQF